ncbi:MAG TPA: TRAM domain-containing protein [Candidatus Limnocylindrales bacterium]|nr:TRAM domain-containing protein [Candidatus Limnocylindrales bacterium]
MIRTIRFLGAAIGGLVGITSVIANWVAFQPTPGAPVLVVGWVVAWIVLGFTLLPYLTVIPAMRALSAVQELSTAEFVTAIIGLFLGLLLGLLVGLPLSNLPAPIGTVAPLGISIFLGLAMVGLTVAKRHDLISAAESLGIIRHVPAGGDGVGNVPRILVDTSAIIDGRIADIAESGFLYGILEVPRFVLDEVQRLADSSDSMRRTRGRRGLEILARMRKEGTTPVQVIDEDAPGTAEVDSKLVALAKRNGRAVLTNDLNLNRIADLQGVRVLNVNSLANAVKPALLPGEDLRVRVIQPGKDAGQGVGYLDDGTMVVVEGGAKSIDSEVDVTVTRVLQTVAGRMVFAHPRQA